MWALATTNIGLIWGGGQNVYAINAEFVDDLEMLKSKSINYTAFSRQVRPLCSCAFVWELFRHVETQMIMKVNNNSSNNSGLKSPSEMVSIFQCNNLLHFNLFCFHYSSETVFELVWSGRLLFVFSSHFHNSHGFRASYSSSDSVFNAKCWLISFISEILNRHNKESYKSPFFPFLQNYSV